MSKQQVSRWARRYVVASASFLVLWQAGLVVGIPRRTSVTLGLFGFVLHMVFGKAYSLLPTYFDRQLSWGWAPGVQFALTVLGALSLAAAPLDLLPARPTATAGAVLWAAGVGVFLTAIGWTIRGNPIGRETATGGVNQDREPVDRFANAFMPLALAYLALGTYATLATHTPLPTPLDGYPPRATHLLAAGTASLLVFAVGFRLLPRFLVATPPRNLVRVVLPAGALAPLLLAWSLPASGLLAPAALLQATAIVGFAVAFLVMFRQSERRRVGFYGVALGCIAGVGGVLFGLHFATGGPTPSLVTAHYRLTLLGFLGLTIVGIAFQFYPPNAARVRFADDRTGFAAIGALAAGLTLQVGGLAAGRPTVVVAGELVSLVGALAYWFLLVALFRER